MKTKIATAVTAFMVLTTPAFAHPGYGENLSFSLGFAHPLSGIDHILAMIAVGLFAVQLGGRALWTLPAAFIAAMIAGGAMSNAAMALSLAEPGIALSVIAMGLLIAFGLKLPTKIAATLWPCLQYVMATRTAAKSVKPFHFYLLRPASLAPQHCSI